MTLQTRCLISLIACGQYEFFELSSNFYSPVGDDYCNVLNNIEIQSDFDALNDRKLTIMSRTIETNERTNKQKKGKTKF